MRGGTSKFKLIQMLALRTTHYLSSHVFGITSSATNDSRTDVGRNPRRLNPREELLRQQDEQERLDAEEAQEPANGSGAEQQN